ncbi:hypothetical protein ACN6MT_19050 [Neobacillus niacini]|uniref:hypothetical protein n=1 Tax=Neobacillus niacini TaxID=86668 RepID=UPI003B019649
MGLLKKIKKAAVLSFHLPSLLIKKPSITTMVMFLVTMKILPMYTVIRMGTHMGLILV